MTEPWIERVIREAQEAGKFDGLPGTGKPIADIDHPYDPAWWARRWVTRERWRVATVELAGRVERELPRVLAGSSKAEVRAGLDSLNGALAEHNAVQGEGNDIPLLDVDALMTEWVQRRR